MPPHCDTLDGPVVVGARLALERKDMGLILPFAPKAAEEDIRKSFDRTLAARKLGKEAADVAELWFFETVVRLHRAGEGAPYTGLKPAGLDWGPIIPRADKAIERGDPKEVVAFLSRQVEEQVRKRFDRAMELRTRAKQSVDAARAYTSAMLGFELYSQYLYTNIVGGAEHGKGAREGDSEH